MPHGVRRSLEEIGELKKKIVEYLATGYGRTFLGACQYVGLGGGSEAYVWRKEDAEFDNAVKTARNVGNENALDVAENVIMDALQSKDLKTTRWFLDRKGVKRGYIPKSISASADLGAMPKIDRDVPDSVLDEAMARLRLPPPG
jgi:hypothetical protein